MYLGLEQVGIASVIQLTSAGESPSAIEGMRRI